MDTLDAASVFAALAQPTRLDAYRLLVAAGPDGLTAGAIAARLGVVASTLSHHLGQLEDAGLVTGRRRGRFMIYAVVPARSRALADWIDTIAGGDAELRHDGVTERRTAARG